VRTVVLGLFACGVVLLTGAPPSFGQTVPTLSLNEAVSEALDRNASLAAERYGPAVAQGALRQARTFPSNPELEIEGTLGRARGRLEPEERRDIEGFGVGISVTVPLRGQRGWRSRAGEAGLERARSQVADAERRITGEVLQAFSDLRLAQERVALARQAVTLAAALRRAAATLADSGEVPQLDLLRAEAELGSAQSRLAAEERGRERAQASLALLLGRPPDATIAVDGPLSLPEPSGALPSLAQAAVEQRSDLRASRAAARAAEAELGLARAERVFPEATIGFKYDQAREFDSINRSGTLTASVPLPLFSRGRGELERAAAERRKQGAETAALQQAIEHEVATAHQQAAASRRIAEGYAREVLPRTERNLQLLHEGYGLGEFALTDVLAGQRELVEARESYLEAIAALNESITALYLALNSRP
jgi:cobalt-zinc-cadmium efflux system outer membrane protein